MHQRLPGREVVLVGAGHSNAHVLRMWRMRPPPDARLTCVSPFPTAAYSGMMPGVLAGLYQPHEMHIDLVRLCAAAGVRLVVAEAVGLDLPGRRVLLKGRPPLPFDLLSVGVGSLPKIDARIDSGRLVPVKPMQTFLGRLNAAMRPIRGRPRVAVVGGGAGGVEVAMCLSARGDSDVSLIHSGGRLPDGSSPAASRRVHNALDARGVKLLLGRRVSSVTDDVLTFNDGTEARADVIVWVTGAAAPPELAAFGLPLDDAGFLLTRPTLQTTAGEPVFAVGDCGTIADINASKAGVHAVRQGPTLWKNINRLLAGRPLQDHKPQRRFLKLLNAGDGIAVGDWLGRGFAGRWVWRWKDRIDRRFMAKYQDYRPMPMRPGPPRDRREMRCLGCGGKVAGSVLRRVLERLDLAAGGRVAVGLDSPDDAAVLHFAPGRAVTATVDFFAAMLEDDYLVGRIAAQHALSDVYAMGAEPAAALAVVTLPEGDPRQQEEALYQVLAGAAAEFGRDGVALCGGHTIEGPRLTVGFTVLGEQTSEPMTKGRLRPGDRLFLTKPLGTGVLLAGHMRAACRAEWMTPLVASMVQSNGPAAKAAVASGATAMTDVTGFGLAGHLLEMLRAGDASAELRLAEIPLLPGAAELLTAGVESTLAPANRRAAATPGDGKTPGYAALFDPQTGGGLLIAGPPGLPGVEVGSVTAAVPPRVLLKS